ncbi:hypothetical protein [Comamonas composti]|uniref:hypothetical protein n=1 Tax=Comamonas composti TaxID=408558 RepID=UPI00041F87AD|nr:hypothetical protein [Comamonas composti]
MHLSVHPISETSPTTPRPGARPHTLELQSKQSRSLCLPPDHELYCLEGQAWLEAGPLLYGQVLGQGRQLLEAGQRVQAKEALWISITARTDLCLALQELQPQTLISPWPGALLKALKKRLRPQSVFTF